LKEVKKRTPNRVDGLTRFLWWGARVTIYHAAGVATLRTRAALLPFEKCISKSILSRGHTRRFINL